MLSVETFPVSFLELEASGLFAPGALAPVAAVTLAMVAIVRYRFN
jgi:hypothetical protein